MSSLYEYDLLNHIFEEKNIHWLMIHLEHSLWVSRTFENFTGKLNLVPLYKDKEDDVQLISNIIQKNKLQVIKNLIN